MVSGKMKGPAKIVAAAVIALAVSGCDGPHELIVHNATARTVRVRLSWSDPYGDQEENWSVKPGGSEERSTWFYSAPAMFNLDVTGGTVIHRKFLIGECPPEMLRSTSFGPICHLWVDRGGLRLEGTHFADKVSDLLPILAALSGCSLPVLFAIIFIAKRVRSNPKDDSFRLRL
jgi:hypothetical protein